jgi:hypothetical protein
MLLKQITRDGERCQYTIHCLGLAAFAAAGMGETCKSPFHRLGVAVDAAAGKGERGKLIFFDLDLKGQIAI